VRCTGDSCVAARKLQLWIIVGSVATRSLNPARRAGPGGSLRRDHQDDTAGSRHRCGALRCGMPLGTQGTMCSKHVPSTCGSTCCAAKWQLGPGVRNRAFLPAACLRTAPGLVRLTDREWVDALVARGVAECDGALAAGGAGRDRARLLVRWLACLAKPGVISGASAAQVLADLLAAAIDAAAAGGGPRCHMQLPVGPLGCLCFCRGFGLSRACLPPCTALFAPLPLVSPDHRTQAKRLICIICHMHPCRTCSCRGPVGRDVAAMVRFRRVLRDGRAALGRR
jgi:hypothetical protein